MENLWKYVVQDEGAIKSQDKNVETMEFEVTVTIKKKIM